MTARRKKSFSAKILSKVIFTSGTGLVDNAPTATEIKSEMIILFLLRLKKPKQALYLTAFRAF